MSFWGVLVKLPSKIEMHMFRQIILVGAMALAMSSGAHAQGVPEGAAHGARVGDHDAGPVGAVVGGVVGGVIGGVNGVLRNAITLLTNITVNFVLVRCFRMGV
jgi:hypothetical protein